MPRPDRVTVFDWTTEKYRAAFELFLANTDQKERAKRELSRIISELSQRRVFVDAGAGNGEVTCGYVERFVETVAVEPNESLFGELQQRVEPHIGVGSCERIDTRRCSILDPQLDDLVARADFVLCSHVLYYLEPADVMPNLKRLASWLAPRGVLAIVMQNPASDAVRMVSRFSGRPYGFSLEGCRESFDGAHADAYESRIETIKASIATDDFETANQIAKWMLVMSDFAPTDEEATDGVPPAPERHVLKEYVRENFARPEGGYQFSCDQDFLLIERRP